MLVFLSVFGGMAWWGLPGALIGPLVMSFFLALYTIYTADFLPAEAVQPAVLPPPVLPPPVDVQSPPSGPPPVLKAEDAGGVAGGGGDKVGSGDAA